MVSGGEVLDRQSDQLLGNEDDTIDVMETGKGSIHQRHQTQPLLIPTLSRTGYGESCIKLIYRCKFLICHLGYNRKEC